MPNRIVGTLQNFLYAGEGIRLVGNLSNFTGELEGGQKYAELIGALPNFEGEVSAYTDRIGNVDGTLTNFTGLIEATTGRIITLSGTLPNFSGDIDATTGRVIAVSGTLSNFTGEISAYFICEGDIVGTLPNFSGSIVSLGTFHIICTNTATRGVTEWSNYNFDSFFEHEGQCYGVNSTGIYLLTGSDDAGTAISAYITGGKSNFGLDTKSTITDVFALTDLDGDANLTLYADGDATGQPYSATGDGSIANKRFKAALGVRGYEWQWKLANVDGSKFDLRRIEVLLDMVNRR